VLRLMGLSLVLRGIDDPPYFVQLLVLTLGVTLTLTAIQAAWSDSPFVSENGPNYGELVALVVSTEWYGNRMDPGRDCPGILLGTVAAEATARQFWYWYYSGRNDFSVKFLSYFQPIRERRIFSGEDLLASEIGLQGLLNGRSSYSENDMGNLLNNIFNNQAWQYSARNPGQAETNCPYGFANRTGRNKESYAQGDALYISGDAAFISFGQQVGLAPSRFQCSTLEDLRRSASCAPLGGLPD